MRKVIVAVVLLSLSAFAQTQHKVVLSWSASPTSGVTYNIYRSTATGACGTTKIVSNVSVLTYTDSSVANGANYFYAVSAQNSGGESACTNEVQVLIPVPPAAPTNLGATVQ